jgi:hypothetical protein
MARLGELLVAARVVAPEQVGVALRAQVVWGGRLGTNLVELGAIDLDTLARALGRQRGLLAALARHFDNADRALQARLPPEMAARWRVVPLVPLSDGTIAVASIDPLDADARSAIAQALEIPPARLVVSIAPELRVHYHLERVYHIPRDTRFVRAQGPEVTPFPQLEFFDEETSDVDLSIPIEVEAPPPRPSAEELEDLIDISLDVPVIEEAPGRTRAPSESGRTKRRYVTTLADAEPAPAPISPSALDARALGRIAIRKVVVETTDIPRVVEETAAAPGSLADAARAIRRGTNRDRVAQLVVEAVEKFAPACASAVLLVVRGDVAFGWTWLSRSGAAKPELAVPLATPGIVPTVFSSNTTARLRADGLGAIDRRLLDALGGAKRELVVVPIAIAGQVMCMIATATEIGAPVSVVETIAAAAGTAFARLMRDASR